MSTLGVSDEYLLSTLGVRRCARVVRRTGNTHESQQGFWDPGFQKHVPTLVTTLKQAREAQCLPTGRQHDPVKVQEHRAQRTKVNDLKKEKVSPHKLRRQTVTDSYAVSPRGLTRPSYLCVGVVPDTTACTGMHSSLISYNYDDDDDYTSTVGLTVTHADLA